jgi:pimeloyl-ACP methyl ester carboxylesterase
MSVAEVNGQHISFHDSGGDRPAIIFSHGFLMDGSMFDTQVAGLADEFRCITWDERGHGGTAATGPFTYWDSADDALALAEHLGVGPAVFAGMSQGGFVSMRAALRAPDQVRGLVLIDTQAGLEDPEVMPLYQGLHDEWVANGPANVQELVASLIFGSGIDVEPGTPSGPPWTGQPSPSRSTHWSSGTS